MFDDAPVIIEGVVTLAFGAIDGDRGGFVQDGTAGIGIYLGAPPSMLVDAGTRVRLAGVLDTRFAQRVIRVDLVDVEGLGADALPDPVVLATGAASEPAEGLRVTLTGTVTEAPSALADGLGLMVDDGTGPVRVIVGPDALGGLQPGRGDVVTATGPLGQRDSSGTGLAGYRLFATLPGELEIAPAPTPTPSPEPTATLVPSASPSPTASPAPTASPTSAPSASPTTAPTPKPSPSPAAMAVAEARLVPVTKIAVVRGVVIAEAGRLGTPPLFAIGDATGGLPVKLGDGQVAPPRGTLVEVRGAIADPYGQTELRIAAGGLAVIGTGPLPAVQSVTPGQVDESFEGRLAKVKGRVTASASKATSGDTAFTIEGSDGVEIRILYDASAGIDPAGLRKGAAVTLTGIVGQRASRKGALDGYRLWLRDPGDVTVTAAPTASPGGSASPSPSSSAGAPRVTIKAARSRDGQRVTVEGTVTVDRTLLDTSGRRTVVEDATGAIELYLAGADAEVKAGVRVRAAGTVGTAWGAPRLRVESIQVLGRTTPNAHALGGAPTESTEWELVRVKGTIDEVHRSGDRWTAELVDGRTRIPLVGLPGSGIASTALVEGRRATVVGIVKRPYPTATDQRFGIVPRSPKDLDLGPAVASPGPGASHGWTGNAPGGSPPPSGLPGASPAAEAGGPLDIELANLAGSVGSTVRVGGQVVAVESDGVRLDDGTAVALVVLEGEASELLALLQSGDTINATGTPDERNEVVLVVTDPVAVVLLGDLGGDEPSLDTGGGVSAAAVPPLGPDAGAASSLLSSTRGAPPLVVGLGTLGLLMGIGAALVGWRFVARRRSERHRIEARIEAFAGMPPAPSAEPSA